MGINTSSFYGFLDNRLAYKFHYTGKNYRVAGIKIAHAMGSSRYVRCEFITELGKTGILGTFNYTPGYFLTNLSGKVFL